MTRKTEKKEVEEKKEILNPQDFYVKLQIPELQKFYEKYGKVKFYKVKCSNGRELTISKKEMFLHKEYKVLSWQDNYGMAIYDSGDKGEGYAKAVYDWETYEEYETRRNFAIKKEAEHLGQIAPKNSFTIGSDENDFATIPEKALQDKA